MGASVAVLNIQQDPIAESHSLHKVLGVTVIYLETCWEWDEPQPGIYAGRGRALNYT